MVTTYEEFKLRVLKKVTDLHAKDQTPFPLLCFQDGEGINRLLRLPPEVFETKNYKEILPDVIGRLLRDTESTHVALILQCTLTSIDTAKLEPESLGGGEIAKSVCKKIIAHRDENIEPEFDEHEHRLIVEMLGTSRVVFLFQSKKGPDGFMSFMEDDETGKLKPAENLDQGDPIKGVFANLFKFS